MKPGTVLLCALLAFGGVFFYGSCQRSYGRAEGRLEAIVKEDVRLRERVAQTDTIYVRTRDTLRQVLTKWETVRSTDTHVVQVPGIPESVVVYVPRAAADTAVSVCLRTLSSCDASLRARDSLLAVQRLHIKSLEAMKPKRCGLRTGLGVTGGVDIQGRPNAVLGVTFGIAC